MTRRRIPVVVVGVLLMLAAIVQYQSPTLASSPGNAAFERTWSRTDRPVADQSVNRTWMWGPEAFTEAIPERYDDAPGGQRTVQYFDKSRMEINHDPNVPEDSPWHVTNGLLVVELMTGRMQIGDNSFVSRGPSQANVAGDQGDSHGVTYFVMGAMRDQPAEPEGGIINKVLTPYAGSNLYLFNDELGSFGITAAHYVLETQHTVAAPFWDFMNSRGTVLQDGGYVDDQLFLNSFYATGFPTTEAYWASVPLAGIQTNVLVQCFERRCLTYTPTNPDSWKVEAGNVGQHYHLWRYGVSGPVEPTTSPSPSPSPTPPSTPSPTPSPSPSPSDAYHWVSTWQAPWSPSSIDVDRNGNVYVANERFTDNLKIYSPQGAQKLEITSAERGWENIIDVSVLSTVDDSYAYVLAEADLNYAVFVFQHDGTYIGGWNISNVFTNELPNALDVDDFGFVTIVGMERIARYSVDGEFMGSLKTPGRWWSEVTANDYNGETYIVDTTGPIGRFSVNGEFIEDWQVTVEQVAVDSNGWVLATDNVNHRVVVLTAEGDFVSSFGRNGEGDGEFSDLRGIAVDFSGNVYVTEPSLNKIQKFSR